MFKTRFVVWTFAVGMLVLCAGGVSGQTYPNKSIRMVSGASGSTVDFVARLIAQALSASLGQPVIVDNQGTGVTAVETVAKAQPDGYTVIFFTNGLWITTLLQNTSYEVGRDFSPISITSSTPNLLIVIPSVAATSVNELITLAKARPGELNYASGNSGSTSHLAGELFKSMAGVNIVRIPYKSGSQQIVDLLSGQVQLTFSSLDGMQDHLKSGRLRALAVGSAGPSALVPGLPTVAASVPGFESVITHAMLAPAKTPQAIITRLNQDVVRFLNTPEAKARLLGNAIVPVASSPEEVVNYIKSEMARMGKVIKNAGITTQ